MGAFKDLTGMRFGRLVVLERTKPLGKETRWMCLCDCGKKKSIAAGKLTSGNTKSCRCLDTEMTIERSTKHGLANKTPEYVVWKTMRSRCNNVNNQNYSDYGGRGISLCDRWNNFELFLKDMGERPTDKHQIDRINNNGNYEPSNCRWTTQLEQANNKRNNVMITFNGVTQTIPQWSRQLNIRAETLRARIRVYKWPVSLALTKGVK